MNVHVCCLLPRNHLHLKPGGHLPTAERMLAFRNDS
jgi:hypothetical protein